MLVSFFINFWVLQEIIFAFDGSITFNVYYVGIHVLLMTICIVFV